MTGRDLELVVFDWDGTLMDSQARIVASLHHAIAGSGLPQRSHGELRNIIGLGLREALLALYPNLRPPQLQALTVAYRSQFLEVCSEPECLFEGARQVIETLRAQGLLLAIATGKGRAGLDRALRHSGLHGYFHSTRCADEAPSKPDPTMLQELMAELGVEPAATLMVGDTEYDLAMARAAKAWPLAVAYGAHERRRLLPYAPVAVLERIGDLPELLAKLSLGGAAQPPRG